MTRRIVGKFWKYTGNSINGRNHEHRTPAGYDLTTVEMVAAIANDVKYDTSFGDLAKLVTKEEARQMDIIHHRGDSFGHEVTVKAPKSVWDKLSA